LKWHKSILKLAAFACSPITSRTKGTRFYLARVARSHDDNRVGGIGARWRWQDVQAAFYHVGNADVGPSGVPAAAQALARRSDYDTTRVYMEVADEIRRHAANAVAERPVLQAIAGGKNH
jgi:hypothetical protein